MTKEVLNTFVLVAIEPKKPLKRPAQSKITQEVGWKCHARIMPPPAKCRVTRQMATRGAATAVHTSGVLTTTLAALRCAKIVAVMLGDQECIASSAYTVAMCMYVQYI